MKSNENITCTILEGIQEASVGLPTLPARSKASSARVRSPPCLRRLWVSRTIGSRPRTAIARTRPPSRSIASLLANSSTSQASAFAGGQKIRRADVDDTARRFRGGGADPEAEQRWGGGSTRRCWVHGIMRPAQPATGHGVMEENGWTHRKQGFGTSVELDGRVWIEVCVCGFCS